MIIRQTIVNNYYNDIHSQLQPHSQYMYCTCTCKCIIVVPSHCTPATVAIEHCVIPYKSLSQSRIEPSVPMHFKFEIIKGTYPIPNVDQYIGMEPEVYMYNNEQHRHMNDSIAEN